MIITSLLTLVNQLKIYHWQTTSYAQHKAFGNIYDTLSNLIDEYVEIFMGKYGIIKTDSQFEISLQNLDKSNYIDFINKNCEFLISDFVKNLDEKKDTDLLNLRDEMLAQLNKLKYLLTLK
jgi:DNA-binding ferritin-like protein